MKKRKRRIVMLFACFILLITSFIQPAMQAKAGNEPSVSMKKESDRINQKVTKAFEKNEKVTFLIKFAEQADTTKAAKEAKDNAKEKKLTSFQAEITQRSAVVNALRSTAIETQREVITYLEHQEQKGNAEDIKSFYIVNGMAVTATKKVMKHLASLPEVEKILPNEIRQIQPIADKTKTKAQTTTETNSIEWNIDRVGAPEVWNMGIDGAGTVIANIDTGVQWDHPALMEQYRGYSSEGVDHEFNWFDAVSGEEAPYDDIAHGTHTMGTMVGVEPDGSNQIGVAPGAKWIAVKAFSEEGGSDIDLLEAGEWIIAPKDAEGNPHPEKAPDVVNNSWGGGPGLDEWYRPMVQNWRNADIFPEFSAGNTTLFNPGGPESIATPANYPESFATGATDINDSLGSFSLQGPSPYDEVKPDVSAPGVNIRSAVPGSNYEGGWNGTSMAAPHVAAIVALLRQADPSLTVDEIEEIFLNSVTPLTDDEFPDSPNNGYGYGLVNAFDAVSSVISGLGTLKGEVMKEGDDEEEPTYQHEAASEAYAGMDLPLTITASDNVSVTNVELEYNVEGEWTSTEAERVDGNYLSGTYQATIPGEGVNEPSVSYRFKIEDYGGHIVTTDEYQVEIIPGITTGYETDFESEPAGWMSWGENNSWEWGAPTVGPEAFSGEKVYGTNLDGAYANSANMTLMMPPIDLQEGAAYLHFSQWYELERNYDYGHLFISTDQENWEALREYNNLSDGWISEEVDLSSYENQRIYLAFQVETDGSVMKQGWYIDDVSLSAEPMEVATKKKSAKVSIQPEEKSSSVKAKEKVNPEKLKPTPLLNSKNPVQEKPTPTPQALPLQAEVSILETGRSATTNLEDGSYSMIHAAGDYTAIAEAYGYQSETQEVTIADDEVTEADFTLEAIPEGEIEGTVTNSETGEPIQGATVLLVEDAAIAPVQTDEEGQYSLTGYEGDYSLKILAAGYYSETFNVTVEANETVVQNAELTPFIGYAGEIGYDDGTAENARAFYDAGNGWAVKMSLAEGQERALVTGGLFRFWNTEWPNPGGTNFKVEIHDASGPDGAPGKKLAGPIDATALRNGEWTMVDLSDQGIIVEGDFYLTYIQADANPNAPGLATDEDGEYVDRSWQYVSGAWSKAPEEEGNYMIRAVVDYELTAPKITSPKDESYTNKNAIQIEGETAPSTTVHLYNNGEEKVTTSSDNEGYFSEEIQLSEGENRLTARASTDRGMTEESDSVLVILDQEKPELSITSPKDGWKTNKGSVTVKGEINDENLSWVKVNGKKAKVENGEYSLRILLEQGQNNIKVVAKDKAGNKTKKSITVYTQQEDLEISNLKPDQNKNLQAGESVKIEFDSKPGIKATFSIHMPLVNPTMMPQSVTEFPMMEVSEGHYEGYWTATSNVVAKGAKIEVKVTDSYGNESRKIAEGQLNINTEE
ncbi:S8 family peptidase [Bacillus sp. RAR_GA_16]|uniref:S8 family peptidase n=1 Tax=Bacillus sp. RAR_GA_16 TaxID=2876774 RepID=UPI001CCF0C9B|nr:S8 family peptidase [Bacillus sp. RAR_GA_16]MCA0170962.1 S8 family serine peptidase [Bacillus sp. RAR_GA_16]